MIKFFKNYLIYILLLILAIILCFSLSFFVYDSFYKYKAKLKATASTNNQIIVETLINEIVTLRKYNNDETVKEIIFDQLSSYKYYNYEYIWINEITNYDGGDNYGFRFFHPNSLDTIGQLLSTSTKDIQNNEPNLIELEGVKKNGYIFYSYYFKNYTNDTVEKKYTYAKLYKDFNWIVACGINESNIYKEALRDYNLNYEILIFFYIVIMSLYIIICLLIYNQRKRFKERENLIMKNMATSAKTDAKSEFLATISHELRTPLTAIIGLNQLLRENSNKENIVIDYSYKIEESSTMLLSIINDVLDMSAIEKGKLKIANIDFNIKRVIYSVSDIYYKLTKMKDLEFEVLLSNIEEEELVGDGHRINQILLNLLSNSLKFTREGKIIVKLMERKIDEKHVELLIEVEDTGCGMNNDMKRRLFHEFEQANASVAKQHGGSGLGLSITKHLVEAMKGSITVESEVDKGSIFKVKIPLEISELSEEVILDLANKKAFIVDDDESTCKYISQIFDSWNIGNISFTSSTKAIEYLKDNYESYSIYILDYMMPEIDGIALSARIAKLDKKAMIILLSGYNIEEIRVNGPNCISAYIQKPIFKSELYNKIINKLSTYKTVSKHNIDIDIDYKGLIVLSVEDNQINQLIISKMLETYGINTIQVKNGKEAVDYMKYNPEKDKISMIFMDIRMPVMNGLEATKSIRKFNKNIPIIALSANAFENDIKESLDSGMNNHIAKPIDKQILLDVLKHYIQFGNENK
ncbi:MAG: response regulator [Spirochaetaceae bacterium]|nr:response regulator [Spirochaetaceae bacterium]